MPTHGKKFCIKEVLPLLQIYSMIARLLMQNLPFWVSLVEQIKVAIWKLSFVLSLVGVKLARWCRFFPEGASFSSISVLVQGRVK